MMSAIRPDDIAQRRAAACRRRLMPPGVRFMAFDSARRAVSFAAAEMPPSLRFRFEAPCAMRYLPPDFFSFAQRHPFACARPSASLQPDAIFIPSSAARPRCRLFTAFLPQAVRH